MGGQCHTYLPIKDKKFAIITDEYHFAYMVDLSDEKYPRLIGMFPLAPPELLERGVGNPWGPGPHNVHEYFPHSTDSWKDDNYAFLVYGAGGLRIFDIHDPYRIQEIGYYVPGTPKVYYDPRGPEHGSNGAGVDVADLWVDPQGLIYLTSYNGAVEIVEWQK
jgi:hypothetical protein